MSTWEQMAFLIGVPVVLFLISFLSKRFADWVSAPATTTAVERIKKIKSWIPALTIILVIVNIFIHVTWFIQYPTRPVDTAIIIGLGYTGVILFLAGAANLFMKEKISSGEKMLK